MEQLHGRVQFLRAGSMIYQPGCNWWAWAASPVSMGLASQLENMPRSVLKIYCRDYSLNFKQKAPSDAMLGFAFFICIRKREESRGARIVVLLVKPHAACCTVLIWVKPTCSSAPRARAWERSRKWASALTWETWKLMGPDFSLAHFWPLRHTLSL